MLCLFFPLSVVCSKGPVWMQKSFPLAQPRLQEQKGSEGERTLEEHVRQNP